MPVKKKLVKVQNPTILITVHNDTYQVVVDWPDLSNKSMLEINNLSDSLYLTSIHLTGGNIPALSILQQSIGYTASIKGDYAFGKNIIEMINKYLIKIGFDVGKASTEPQTNDEPLISSEEVLEEI